MKILNYKDIEYSEVHFDELYGDMRIDSVYYQPEYIRNAETIEKKLCKSVRDFMYTPQYGISIAMNEDGVGYKILKMDDIIGILANDENAKYADISEKLYKQFQLNKFDVLFNRVNSDEFVGRTGIYLLDGDHTFASYLVRLTSAHTYQNCYLTVFLNCSFGYKSLQRVKRRAVNQANINAQELKALRIPFPSIDFQKEIEYFLMESYNQKKISELLYKESENLLLKEIGLDILKQKNVEFLIGKTKFNVPYSISDWSLNDFLSNDRLDSEYWQPFYTAIENIILSYKNGVKSIGESCKLFDNNFFPEADKFYKYIELSNIGKFGNINGYTFELGSDLPTRARRQVFDGQIIISSIEGSLESCALITNEYHGCLCSNGFHVLKSEEINSESLLILFKSMPFQMLLKKGCTGTILTAINKRFLRKIPLPMIDKKIQSLVKIKVNDMYKAKIKSQGLIENAKKAVEIFIEEDEKAAMKFLNKQR